MAAPNIVNVSTITGKTAVQAVSTSATAIVTNSAASGKVYKVNSVLVSNVDGTNSAEVTIDLYRSSTAYHLIKTASVPAGSTLDLLAKTIYLEEGDSVRLTGSALSDLEAVCSYEEIDATDSAVSGIFSTLTATGNTELGDAEATDTHAIKGATTLLANTSSDALRITQTGAGNALVVEDSANPDGTPLVVDNDGNLLVGLGTARAIIGYTGGLQLSSVSFTGKSAILQSVYRNDAGGTVHILAKSRGTAEDTFTVVQNNDNIAFLQFAGSDGSSFVEAASISAAVDGTPGTNDMPGRLVFSTTADGGSTPTERMRIDSSGNTSISGTATVEANTSSDALRITQTGSGNALVVEDSANPDSTPFVVDSTGRLLVGTNTSRSYYLPNFNNNHPAGIQGVGNSYQSPAWMVLAQWSTSTTNSGGGFLSFNKSNGSEGTHTIVIDGQRVGAIGFAGSDGTNFVGVADISAEVDGTPGTNDMPGRLIFSTTADGASLPTERMRIDSSGNVGIGVTSVSYQLQLSTDSAGKPSTNTWTIVSDERIKEHIELADLDLCYDAVKNIPLKRFKWKDEVYSEDQVADRHKLGWIAQDVEAVYPKAVSIHEFKYNQVYNDVVIPATEDEPERIEKELVSEDAIEDCRDLNADQIYAAMYGAVQKLIQKVESLETRIAELEA